MNDQGIKIPVWILGFFGIAVLAGIITVAVTIITCKEPARNADLRTASGQEIIAAEVVVKPENTAAAVANGDASYTAACAACHGANQEGVVGPSLADADWLHGSDENTVFRNISKGISAEVAKTGKGAMPAKGLNPGLTDAQVWEIVFFLESKNKSIKAK